MKRSTKLIVAFIVLLGLTLTFAFICMQRGDIKMPRTKGSEVTLTEQELSDILNELVFDLKEDSIYEYYREGTNYLDNVHDSKFKGTSVTNNKTNEFWVNSEHYYKNDYSLNETTINGYENLTDTYFDVDFKVESKNEHGEKLTTEVNGSYKVIKQNIGLGYADLSYLNSETDTHPIRVEFGEFNSFKFNFDLIKELHQKEFGYLKFYKNNNYFTIELILNLDYYNAMDIGFPPSLYRLNILSNNRHTFDRHDFHAVYVFKDNYLHEAGSHLVYSIKPEYIPSYLGENINEYTIESIDYYRIINKSPKKFKDSKYTETDDIQSLFNR